MNELFEKYVTKKNVLCGVVIVVVLTVIWLIFGMAKDSPDKIMKNYSEVLVNGNYEDVIELIYFPESEFITDEEIDVLKGKISKEMSKNYDGVVDCEFVESEDKEGTITYKLTLETTKGYDTEFVEIDKEKNKIVSKKYYKVYSFDVNQGSKVKVDGKELSKKYLKKSNKVKGVDSYSLVALIDSAYNLEITHPLFETEKCTLIEHVNNQHILCNLKKEYHDKFEKELEVILMPMFLSYYNKEDLSGYNKYFKNGDAKEFAETLFSETVKRFDKDFDYQYLYIFKDVKSVSMFGVNYLGDNEFSVKLSVWYDYSYSLKNGSDILFVDGKDTGFRKSIDSTSDTRNITISVSFDNGVLISEWKDD